MMSKSFKEDLLQSINKSLSSGYKGVNKDFYRFPNNELISKSIKERLKCIIGKYYTKSKTKEFYLKKFSEFYSKYGAGLETTYNLLNDLNSKVNFIEVFTYSIVKDYFKFRYSSDFEHYYKTIDNYFDLNDVIIDEHSIIKELFRLNKDGFDTFHISKLGFTLDFLKKQYEYKTDEIRFGINEGDVVIDGGGSIGDTALYFAHETKKNCTVHSFEFVPYNINILEKNLASAKINNLVQIVNSPLWSVSNKIVYFDNRGSASNISFEKKDGLDMTTKTIAIDDYTKSFDRLDFLKLDIEGAEMDVLKGSVEALKKFKPNLAICLYHSLNDYMDIPAYLDSMNLGYKFYFKHSTIYHEESVLFATTK